MREVRVRSITEMAGVAEEVLSVLPQRDSAHVLALTGELGAGKTTFVQRIAKALGIREHVVSPTFVLMKVYPVSGHDWIRELVHIDAYRVEDSAEMQVLRLEDLYKRAGALICIEWPERIARLIPEDAVKIGIRVLSDGSRDIHYAR